MSDTHSHVLLVDDDPTILRILARFLESSGYQVTQATDGRQAVALIDKAPPDILITDWDMPGCSGLELCQHVRTAGLPHYVYVLFVTGKSSSDDMIAGLGAGADDFVTKPVSRGELLARLRAGARVLALERQLSMQARTDPLTGIATQRVFYEKCTKEMERARQRRTPISCVMLDVDFFKRINDTHGHAIGDAVLKRVAQLLTEECREADSVCRYGGEEFCALLPEAAEKEAVQWAERVRQAIADLRFRIGDKVSQVTASFGVSQLLDDVKSPEQFLDQADQALLAAKQAGRNRVTSYRGLYESDRVDARRRGGEHPLDGTCARDVMNSPVACLRQEDLVREAVDYFLRFRINSAAVVDDARKLVGVLSEKDVLSIMLSPDSWGKPIREVMNPNVICYDDDTPARVIYEFLCRVTIRGVIIVKDGEPIGNIRRGTLLRWFHSWIGAQREGASPPTEGELSQDAARSAEQLMETAEMLVERATNLRDKMVELPEFLLPVIIDETSKIQELTTDLLSFSRGVQTGGVDAGQQGQVF